MDKINFNDLNQWIDNNQREVERQIISERTTKRRIRTRQRDPDEQKILNNLCIEKWKKAEQEGKIKYLSKRKWYYEVD
ncbi:hypothetical protein RZN22_06405 [Bacillaceae bacterium S4-13-58]